MDNKRSFWESHVEAWRAGGQTQSGYCREHGLSLPSFGYWRRKLAAKAAPASKDMIPIALTTRSAAGPSVAIALPNRLTVRVPMSAEPSRVATWVQVLGTC